MSDERCPTCGSTVKLVSSDEGTAHYEPLPRAERSHAKTTDALLLLAVARESMLVDDTHEQRIDAFYERGLLQAVATGNPGQYEAHLTEAGWALLHDALEGAGEDG